MNFICGRIHYRGLYRIGGQHHYYYVEKYVGTASFIWKNTSCPVTNTYSLAMDALISLIHAIETIKHLDKFYAQYTVSLSYNYKEGKLSRETFNGYSM